MNHKSWIKIIINPIITKFGWILVSKFDKDNFIGFEFRHYPENCNGPFKVWINLFRK